MKGGAEQLESLTLRFASARPGEGLLAACRHPPCCSANEAIEMIAEYGKQKAIR
jgi:putative component of membrane protein insertase Oxa1/YidC/SpoIIIJ protein YidD